jgi:hypothetical protein
MAINFPSSGLTVGQIVQQADRAWTWDGEKWKATGTTSTEAVGASVIFEGGTANEFETTLTVVDPTADRTITLPNADGTVAFTSDIPTVAGVYAPLASPAFTGNVTVQSLDMDTIVAGDVIYGSGADTLARLAKGSDTEVLTLASGVPSWAAAASSGVSWSGSTANGLATYGSGSSVVSESTATYDGTTLQLTTSGGGLKLDGLASSNANTLDDYEEGTWTPAIECTGSGTMTVANTLGYVKVGKMVWLHGYMNVTAVSSPTGRADVTGLPFVSENGSTTIHMSSPIAVTNLGADMRTMAISPHPGQSKMYIRGSFNTAGGYNDSTANQFSGNESIYLNVHYRASA